MKIVFGLSVLLMCSGIMLVQPAYATKSPRDTLSECLQRVEKLEKEKQKQPTPAERVRALEEKSNQTAQPKFAPYSYP